MSFLQHKEFVRSRYVQSMSLVKRGSTETCPACHFVSTKDASFCAVCGFAFSSKISTPVVVEEEEEKEDGFC